MLGVLCCVELSTRSKTFVLQILVRLYHTAVQYRTGQCVPYIDCYCYQVHITPSNTNIRYFYERER